MWYNTGQQIKSISPSWYLLLQKYSPWNAVWKRARVYSGQSFCILTIQIWKWTQKLSFPFKEELFFTPEIVYNAENKTKVMCVSLFHCQPINCFRLNLKRRPFQVYYIVDLFLYETYRMYLPGKSNRCDIYPCFRQSHDQLFF